MTSPTFSPGSGSWARSDLARAATPVIFVVFQSGRSANGGVESITQIIERLRNVHPVVVTQMETAVNRRWADSGAAVHVIPVDENGGRMLGLLGIARMNGAVRKLVRRSGARVVHCNDIRALWHAGPGARAAGASLVFNVRDVKPPQEAYGWNWRLAQIANRILVLSGEMREEISRRLPGAVPGLRARTGVEHIYSIVDLERMSPLPEGEREPLRKRLGIPAGEFAIAYVAAISEKKSQLRFIEEAGSLLRDRVPHARIHFVGDFHPERDEYTRRCLESVERLQLQQMIRFQGYSGEVADWYRACDLAVLASRREGLARCIIESLACGTPVVSFDVCSAREVLEQNECGYVVPRDDYVQLVDRVAELAQHASLRKEMGARGALLARSLFSAEHIIAEYERVYEAVARRLPSG